MATFTHDVAIVVEGCGTVGVLYKGHGITLQGQFGFVVGSVLVSSFNELVGIHRDIYVASSLYFTFSINTSQRNTAFYAVNHCVAARTRIGLL